MRQLVGKPPLRLDFNLLRNHKCIVDVNPRYRAVLSILVWPSRSWTARRLPILR